MLPGERFDAVDDVLLDVGSRLGRISCSVGNRARREVGVVHRVVDRDRDLKGLATVDDGPCHANPHGLDGHHHRDCQREAHEETGDTLTATPEMAGFLSVEVDNLRRAASELFDSKATLGGDMVRMEGKEEADEQAGFYVGAGTGWLLISDGRIWDNRNLAEIWRTSGFQ